jgi:NAD(P)-dependent dehydrogenase (short-subunit alcohol dehydrogenase family)
MTLYCGFISYNEITPMNSSSFKEKTVLVTGGASGIGRALCEAFAAAGARVYAADINETGLKELVADAEEDRYISALTLDVSQRQDFKKAIGEVLKEHGRLDILVNNAGIVLAGAFSDTSEEEMEKIVDINLWSVLHGTQLAYAQMITQGYGQIVNVSSSGGLMPVPNQTMYSAIKHAVVGFSHSLREEAALHGVKINTVFPGMVQSDLWDSAINVKDYNMKQNMEATGLKPIPASEAASAILQGIEANQRSIIFPRINKAIVRLYQLFPGLMTRVAVGPLAKPKQ